jgi:hypothetical protein
MAWLREFLGRYAFPSGEISAAARAAGFSFSALREAKARLGRDGSGELTNKNYGGDKSNDWWSGLGPYEKWTKRPSGGPTDRQSDTPNIFEIPE